MSSVPAANAAGVFSYFDGYLEYNRCTVAFPAENKQEEEHDEKKFDAYTDLLVRSAFGKNGWTIKENKKIPELRGFRGFDVALIRSKFGNQRLENWGARRAAFRPYCIYGRSENA